MAGIISQELGFAVHVGVWAKIGKYCIRVEKLKAEGTIVALSLTFVYRFTGLAELFDSISDILNGIPKVMLKGT